jgi:hypothetical protein
MSELSKQALKVENNQSFPNNNAGLITPSALRTFNEDMIDSTVNQATYTTDSASFDTRINNITGSATNTGSLLTTASAVDNVMTFTKGDGSQFNVTVGSVLPSGLVSGSSQIDYPFISNIPSGIVSGSSQITPLLPTGVVSGSSQVILQSTTGNLSGSRIDGLVLSSSFAISSSHSEFSDNSTSSSYAVSASHAELADNATNSTFSIYADNTIVYGKNVTGVSIPKGTPLYFTGSGTGGNLVGVIPADAGNPILMPAGGVAGETIGIGAEGIVLLDGFITNVNTSLFAPGDEVFVAVGGGYTNIIPTGSNNLIQSLGYVERSAVNGSGVIQLSGEARGVPNIQQGYTWVGNSNGVAIPATTQSVVEHIFTQNNTFTGTQTFDNIAVNGTGSFAYIQSVTGSAKVIGDAFIILNNDTPTERYAGIIVQDSGSTPASASFLFDGLTNDWFYEYTSANDPDNFGVVLFGPEYNVKGSPIYPTDNRIQKGDGGHHILDSNISDDGSTVSINSNTQVTGSLSVNGQSVLVGSDLNSLNNFTQSAEGRLNNIELTTQSLQTQVDGLSNATSSYALSASVAAVDASQQLQIDSLISATGSYITSSVDISSLNQFTASQELLNTTFATTGSNTFVGNQTITGTVTISGSATNDLTVIGNIKASGSTSSATINPSAFIVVNNSGGGIGGGLDFGNYIAVSTADGSELTLAADANQYSANWTKGPSISSNSPSDTYPAIIGFQNKTNWTDGRPTFLTPVDISGSVSMTGTLTSSLQQGYVWVGDANGRTTTVSTGSFGGGGGGFPFTGNAVIVGSLGMSGSLFGGVIPLSITSNTASVDFSLGNMFTLTLAASSTTHIIPTNIRQGQTCNIQITQPTPATGSISFSPLVLFAGGADYQPTATGSAVDMLTLVSFNGTNVLGTSIKNFL